MIGELSGLKVVRVRVFLSDSDRCFVMREQFVERGRRESPAFLVFMRGNDNCHRKNSKATNPSTAT